MKYRPAAGRPVLTGRIHTELNALLGQDTGPYTRGSPAGPSGQMYTGGQSHWTIKQIPSSHQDQRCRFPETDGYPKMHPNLWLCHRIAGQSIDQRKSDRKKNMNIRTRDGCTHVCMLMMYTPSCSLCLSVCVSGFVSQQRALAGSIPHIGRWGGTRQQSYLRLTQEINGRECKADS